ncbi:MAG TPA: AAA family ATPase [Candidatus Binatia bacterium]|jgi:general secretion pathway protein A|nr:AAA family ATPase [Candidatus Binatia bacterium]
MYENFYGFREPPFRITPDPRFLYRNPCYEEAAAALAYGIDHRKGFLSLVGEAGTGKTTLLRYLLDHLSAGTRTVLLLHPTVSFDEILEYILMELGVPVDGARKLVLLQRLNEFLLEHTRSGGNVVLLIDEAQDLDARVLEELRLLSNLETGSEKILQILLAGQPELEAKLAQPNLRQLRQRIAMHVRLRPLAPGEVVSYVHTRLEHAGCTDRDLFTTDALARIAEVTGGIPRIVNVLCDACLVTGFATGSRKITAAVVEEAWVDYERLLPPSEVPPVIPEPVRAPVAAPLPPVAVAPPPPPPVVTPASEPVAAAPEPIEPEAAPVVAAVEPEPDPVPPAPIVVAPVEPPPPPPRAAEPAAPMEPRERSRLLVALPLAAAAVIALVVGVYSAMPDVVDFVMETPSAAPPPVTIVASVPSTSLPEVAPADPTPAEPEVAEVPPTDPFVEPAAVPEPAAVDAAAPAPTPAEARAIVHEFRLAYEDRDVPRLMTLFAPGASENGVVDRTKIAEAYRKAFADIDQISYTLPDIVVVANDDRVTVSGPFVITYRQDPNGSGEMRGTASWDIARRDGQPRIVALRYSFGPGATASR